jgi:hypothetical protein
MSKTLTTTKLYNVTSVIDGWPHRGSVYNGVQVIWFVESRDTDPGFDYAAMLEGCDLPALLPANTYERGLVDDLFTEDEAAQLAAYLKTAHDIDVEITEEPLPIATRSADGVELMSVSALAVGGTDDFYNLYMHDEYTLQFRVCGYFSMLQEPTPLRVEDKRGGEWVPVDPPEPYQYPGFDFLIQATPATGENGSSPC